MQLLFPLQVSQGYHVAGMNKHSNVSRISPSFYPHVTHTSVTTPSQQPSQQPSPPPPYSSTLGPHLPLLCDSTRSDISQIHLRHSRLCQKRVSRQTCSEESYRGCVRRGEEIDGRVGCDEGVYVAVLLPIPTPTPFPSASTSTFTLPFTIIN